MIAPPIAGARLSGRASLSGYGYYPHRCNPPLGTDVCRRHPARGVGRQPDRQLFAVRAGPHNSGMKSSFELAYTRFSCLVVALSISRVISGLLSGAAASRYGGRWMVICSIFAQAAYMALLGWSSATTGSRCWPWWWWEQAWDSPCTGSPGGPPPEQRVPRPAPPDPGHRWERSFIVKH